MSLQGTAIEVPAPGTPSMPELKTLYYNQMIRFHKQSNNYIEIVRCLLAMYADVKAKSSDQWAPLLKQIVWCVFVQQWFVSERVVSVTFPSPVFPVIFSFLLSMLMRGHGSSTSISCGASSRCTLMSRRSPPTSGGLS